MKNDFETLRDIFRKELQDAPAGKIGDEARRNTAAFLAGIGILERFVVAIEAIGVARPSATPRPDANMAVAADAIDAGAGVILADDGKVYRAGNQAGWFVGLAAENIREGFRIAVRPDGAVFEDDA